VRLKSLLPCLLCTLWSIPTSASVIDGPAVDPATGYTYYLLSPDTWTNSEGQAVAMGGTLAIVPNAATNSWIVNTFAPYINNAPDANLWIGLYDPTGAIKDDGPGGPGSQHAADFVWVNGAPITYLNWAENGTSQPDDYQGWGGEYWTAVYTETPTYATGENWVGEWNDQNENGSGETSYGVVEVVPEPSAFAMLCMGFAVLLPKPYPHFSRNR
jgi:hypothetical protein